MTPSIIEDADQELAAATLDITTPATTKLTVPKTANMALITIEEATQGSGKRIRMRTDGEDPTTSSGHLLAATAYPFTYRGELRKLRFLNESTGGCLMRVSYYAT